MLPIYLLCSLQPLNIKKKNGLFTMFLLTGKLQWQEVKAIQQTQIIFNICIYSLLWIYG